MERALNTICWYNGHTARFLNLAEELKAWNKKEIFRWEHDVDSEEHTIWMILVSKFGDWGSSINSGWINYDTTENAANFLFNIFQSDIDEELFIKDSNGEWIENYV